MNRSYHWVDRCLIALACVGAVLLLSLGGCERRTCVRWHEEWHMERATVFGVPVGDVWPHRVFVCDQWADGGHP